MAIISYGQITVINVDDGEKGDTAEWFYGTVLTHTSGTATTNIPGAVVGAMYLNTETSLVYKCTNISDSTMTWTYAGDLTTGVLTNIQVGGRNLIRNTNSIDLSEYATRPNINGDTTSYAYGSGGTMTVAEHGIRYTVNSATRPSIAFGQNNINIGLHGLETGKTYTWSFDYTMKTFSGSPPSTSSYRLRAYLGYVPSGESSYNTSTYKDIYIFYASDTSDRGAEVSGHGEFTFELPEGATAMRFWLATNSTNTSYYATGDFIELRNIKLEVGNIATAWTPAPEDVDAQIDNIQVGGKNLLTGTNSTIELTATGLWEDHTWRTAGDGVGTITSVTITDCPDKSITTGWQFDVSSTSGEGYARARSIGQNRVKTATGQEYTLSCYAKGTGKLYMFYGVSSFAPTDLSGKIDLTSEWKRYSITFTAESGTAYVNNNGSNVFFGIWGTNVTGYICGMKLETGNKLTDWSPAPEDIDSDISNVETNLANTKTALEDDVYGDVFWQYTTGGTTYDVWLDESTGNYTYVDNNGDMATVAYANLDVDTETGEKATIRKGGMLDNIEVINGSILIDNNEPSVTVQAVKKTNSGTVLGDSKLKLLSERISFEKNGTEVMYLDSTEDDGVIDINSARVHNSLKIGHLELFDHNGGIGIRRWD